MKSISDHRQIGFYGVFSITAFLQFAAFCYGVFVLKEPKSLSVKSKSVSTGKSFLCDFFDKKHVVETFKVAFKTGPKRRRLRIILLFVVLIVVDGPFMGEL